MQMQYSLSFEFLTLTSRKSENKILKQIVLFRMYTCVHKEIWSMGRRNMIYGTIPDDLWRLMMTYRSAVEARRGSMGRIADRS